MNTFENTLKKLEKLESYLGGDNEDVPINKDAIVNYPDLHFSVEVGASNLKIN
jgi:galactose-1-phosphate uridylyltransferase